MIVADTIQGQTFTAEYRMSDSHGGKYYSGFHAYLVERVDADDWTGDTDYGGAVLYGRRIDYWDPQGFHTLVTWPTADIARAEYDRWCEDFYADTHEHESTCWVCGGYHCGCGCSLDEHGNAHQFYPND